MKVAIIGAGPSGLTTLKYLVQSPDFLGNDPVEVKLFEGEEGVGGTFYARMYEDGEVSPPLSSFAVMIPRWR